MIEIYGLKTCDTCRKAVKLLQAGGRPHRFHDLRAGGLAEQDLMRWIETAGLERLVNRRSTTWRGLLEAEKAALDSPQAARLLLRHPTLIKRPVVEAGDRLVIGFGPAEQAALKALASSPQHRS